MNHSLRVVITKPYGQSKTEGGGVHQGDLQKWYDWKYVEQTGVQDVF